jgi:LuxR family maltose regulon positive regulatory protein
VFGSIAALDAGAGAESERLITHFAQFAATGTGLDVSGYDVVRACQAMGRGELKQALLFSELSVDRDRAIGFANGQAIDLHIAAYLHLALGDEASGREALREARGVEEAHRHPVLRHERLVIEADHVLQQGDLEQCLTLLREAFAIGRELEVYNMFAPPSPRVAELCRIALLHDIEREYTRELIRRKDLFRYAAPLELSSWPWPIQIRTLGGLELSLDEQPLALGRVRIPLLLLRLLTTEPGNRAGLPLTRVQSALWPESDGDNAAHAFEMTVLRLRNQLGQHGRRALRVERGQVLLDPALCWTDTAALSALLGDIASLEPEVPGDPAQLARYQGLADRLVALYRGPFAPDEDAASPLAAYSERLQARVASAARSLGTRLFQFEDGARAEALYLKLLEADGLLDPLLAPAAACLVLRGRRAEARVLIDARKRRPEAVSGPELAEAEAALARS